MSTSNPQELFSPFLPTTYSIPEDDERLKTYLNDNYCRFADVINDKKIGNYVDTFTVQNGEDWSYKTVANQSTSKVRNGFQSITYIPSLPNNGVLVITRQTDPQYPIETVNEQFVITKLFGTASKPCSQVGAGDGNYFMYNCEGDSRITFTFSDIQITITTTVDLSQYSGFIIVEFLNDGR